MKKSATWWQASLALLLLIVLGVWYWRTQIRSLNRIDAYDLRGDKAGRAIGTVEPGLEKLLSGHDRPQAR